MNDRVGGLRLATVATVFGAALMQALPSGAADPTVSMADKWMAVATEARLVPMDGKPLPFTAAGRTRYQESVAGLKRDASIDAAVHLCVPQGIPRAMTSAYPFQIVETQGQVTFLYEENRAFRIVKLADQHEDPAVWDPSYMGNGIAKWNPDRSLTIDSTNFNAGKIYLDASGLPASNKLRVLEHLSLSADGQELRDVITIDDPEIFTSKWSAQRVYRRRTDIELQSDWVCGEKHRDLSAIARTAPNAAALAAATPSAAQLALNGYWRSAEPPRSASAISQAAAGTPRISPGLSAMLAKQQPWAAAEYRKAAAAFAAGEYVPTPEMQCIPAQAPGTSRIAPGGYGFEVLVTARYVVVLAEANSLMRIVRINGQHPSDLTPGWQGDSVGRWEGDELVVDTIGFNDKNYLDRGVPFTSKMHIVERLRLVDGQLVNDATFDDPGAFNGPFSIRTIWKRSEPFQEYICQENNREGGVPTSTGRTTEGTIPR